MTAHFVILHFVIDGVRVTGFKGKVSARMGQSPLFGEPQHRGWGSRSPARISCKAAARSHSQQPRQGAFDPGLCNTLTQEDMETPGEEGLGEVSGTHWCKPLFAGLGDTKIGFKAPEVGRCTSQGSTWYPALPKPVWGLYLGFVLGFYKGQG